MDCLGDNRVQSDLPDWRLSQHGDWTCGRREGPRFCLVKSKGKPHVLGGIPGLPGHWLCD